MQLNIRSVLDFIEAKKKVSSNMDPDNIEANSNKADKFCKSKK